MCGGVGLMEGMQKVKLESRLILTLRNCIARHFMECLRLFGNCITCNAALKGVQGVGRFDACPFLSGPLYLALLFPTHCTKGAIFN